MSDDEMALICALVSQQPLAHPGSIKQWCEVCAEEVWMSVEGQTFRARQPVKILCTECGVGIMALDQEAQMKAVPGAERYGSPGPAMRDFQRRVAERKAES